VQSGTVFWFPWLGIWFTNAFLQECSRFYSKKEMDIRPFCWPRIWILQETCAWHFPVVFSTFIEVSNFRYFHVKEVGALTEANSTSEAKVITDTHVW